MNDALHAFFVVTDVAFAAIITAFAVWGIYSWFSGRRYRAPSQSERSELPFTLRDTDVASLVPDLVAESASRVRYHMGLNKRMYGDAGQIEAARYGDHVALDCVYARFQDDAIRVWPLSLDHFDRAKSRADWERLISDDTTMLPARVRIPDGYHRFLTERRNPKTPIRVKRNIHAGAPIQVNIDGSASPADADAIFGVALRNAHKEPYVR